jgi:hypothetical protein
VQPHVDAELARPRAQYLAVGEACQWPAALAARHGEAQIRPDAGGLAGRQCEDAAWPDPLR